MGKVSIYVLNSGAGKGPTGASDPLVVMLRGPAASSFRNDHGIKICMVRNKTTIKQVKP